nr:MAG TPA: actin cytoskeleton-regulatory complex protein [Bacteriophage sp.]
MIHNTILYHLYFLHIYNNMYLGVTKFDYHLLE